MKARAANGSRGVVCIDGARWRPTRGPCAPWRAQAAWTRPCQGCAGVLFDQGVHGQAQGSEGSLLDNVRGTREEGENNVAW